MATIFPPPWKEKQDETGAEMLLVFSRQHSQEHVKMLQFRLSLVVRKSGSLTSRHNDISQPHGRLNVLLKGRLHKLVVLLDDAFDVPSALCDIPAEPADQPNV